MQVKLGVGVYLWPLNCLLALSRSIRQTGMWKDGGLLSLNHLHPLKLRFRKDDLHHMLMCTWAPKTDRKRTYTNAEINMRCSWAWKMLLCFSTGETHKHLHVLCWCIWLFMFSLLFLISKNLHDLEEYLAGSPAPSNIRACTWHGFTLNGRSQNTRLCTLD